MDGQRYSETLAYARKAAGMEYHSEDGIWGDRPMFVVVVGFVSHGPVDVYGPFEDMAEASHAADGMSFEDETREIRYVTAVEVKS